jgi:T5SS/PEP-CTERM-associated repeat protein
MLNLRFVRQLVFSWVVFGLCAFGVINAQAAIATWGDVSPIDDELSGSWFVGNDSWGAVLVDGGSLLPTSNAYVGFDSGVSGTVTISGDGTSWEDNENLYVGYSGVATVNIEAGAQLKNNLMETCYLGYNLGSQGTVNVSGSGSLLNWNANQGICVGYSGDGILNVKSGGFIDNQRSAYLGYNSGARGEAVVSGLDSTLKTAELFVGYDGQGSLTVAEGGVVNAQTIYAAIEDLHGDGVVNTTGTVLDADLVFDRAHGLQQTFAFGTGGKLNIDCRDKTELGAGFKGKGSLTIADGVAIDSGYNGYLGFIAGSEGTATVTGKGSQWNNYEMYVGRNGKGNLNIEAGGAINTSMIYVGYDADSTGSITVSGDGSTLNMDSVLYLGDNGKGMLKIEAGGRVDCDAGFLAMNPGSTGNAIVAGTGSQWNCQHGIIVGELGDASLAVSDGGKVSTPESLSVGYIGKGSLTVERGGTVNTGTLLASLSDLHGDGVINCKGAVLDWDITFDRTHTIPSQLNFGSGGVIHLDYDGSGDLGVGYKSKGTLRIAEGVTVHSQDAYFGYCPSSYGMATITGEGSTWNVHALRIGISGNAALNIESGATVHADWCQLEQDSQITITGPVSQLLLSSDLVVHFGNATLTIANGGHVSNARASIGNWIGDIAKVMVSGTDSRWANSGEIYVGNGGGSGVLDIEQGGQVTSAGAYLGNDISYMDFTTPGHGLVKISGSGSKWINNGDLVLGKYGGHGEMIIDAGGQVSNANVTLGMGAGTIGKVIVKGSGSGWSNGDLRLGDSEGTGTLNIFDGGAVTAYSVSINGKSRLTINIDGGSSLNVGNGTGQFTNRGILTLIADTRQKANQPLKPILATWEATSFGAVQTFGGTWNERTHEFTASPVMLAVSGMPIYLSRKYIQRALVNDDKSRRTLGISFPQKDEYGNEMAITAVYGDRIDALKRQLNADDLFLAAWSLSAPNAGGVVENDPLYLLFGLDTDRNFNRDAVQIWSYAGNRWAKIEADDLVSEGNFVGFSADRMGTYAITVPEPIALCIFLPGMLALAAFGMRKWRRV